jgi:AcrR family transcriptional regulator
MPEPRPRTQQKYQRLKRQLIELGVKLMAEKGIKQCAVEDITKAAAIGKGTFFNIFKNKTDFLCQSLEYWFNDLNRRLSALNRPGQNCAQLLAGVGGVYLRYFQLRPEVAALLMQALSLPAPGGPEETVKQILARHVTNLVAVIEPACQGTDWQEHCQELALSILSVSCGFFVLGKGLINPSPQTLDRLSRILARGLA